MTDKAIAYLVSRAMSEDHLSFSKVKGALSNTPLYSQAAQPDCRTCANYDARGNAMGHQCVMKCVNGNEYLDTAKVVLWRTE